VIGVVAAALLAPLAAPAGAGAHPRHHGHHRVVVAVAAGHKVG